MNREQDFDLDYRPDSYWDTPEAIHANIKGDFRQRAVKDAIAAGELDKVPSPIFADEISDELRHFAGSINPSFMGGEYLPSYLENEVEIARVSLNSVTADVTSIRAIPGIHYRVVDEYETHYQLKQARSQKPLTMREIIALLDTVERKESDSTGLVRLYWENLEPQFGPEEDVDFTTVSSAYYPALEQWWEAEAAKWLATNLDEAMLQVAQSKDLTSNSPAGGKEEGTSPRVPTVDQLRTTAAESLVARGIAKDLDEALEMVDEQF